MEDMKFDRVQLGYAMSAFFAAYALTQIPGGILAERWGIRKNGAFAMFWWSLFTFLTPHAWGFASFLVVRFLFGLGEGPLYPNNGFFFAKWFSSKEKAIANSWMSAGTLLGPALGPPLTVFLVTHTSWHWAFYVFGFAGFIATALWWIYARDTPAEHPKINDAELLIITEQTNVQDAVSEASKKIKTPWGKFLKNHRFWAIGFQYMDNALQQVETATGCAGKSREALQLIVSDVESTAGQVRAIAVACEQQSAASEAINNSIEHANSMHTVATSAPQKPATCQPISVASSEPGPGAIRAMAKSLRN